MNSKILYPLFLAVSLVALDQTVVATALPAISAELKSTSNYSWVVAAYLLSSAVVMPLAGRMTDLYGGKRPLSAAIVAFVIGSTLCGFASSIWGLVAARAVQGLGGGAILAVGTGIIGIHFKGSERGSAFATMGVSTGVAAAIGPLLGGVVSQHLSWRYLFWGNIPLGFLAVIGVAAWLTDLEKEQKGERMDWLGALFCLLWSVPLLFVFSWGGSVYAWTSSTILGLVSLTMVGLALFSWREWKSSSPLFDLRLFRIRAFLCGTLAYFWMGATTTTTVIFFPLYLVQILGYSSSNAGLVLTVEVLGLIAGNSLAARWTKATNRYYQVLLTGNTLALVSLIVFAYQMNSSTGLPFILACLVSVGLGFGLAVPVYPSAVQRSVPMERMGTASSAMQFGRILGAALGTALMGTLMISGLQNNLPSNLSKNLSHYGIKVDISDFEEPSSLEARFHKAYQKANSDSGVTPKVSVDQKQFEKLEKAVERSARDALLKAIQRIYLAIGLMALFTLLFTALIPNREMSQDQIVTTLD